MTYQAQSQDRSCGLTVNTEFQLRAEIDRLNRQSGRLRVALIFLLQETPKDALKPEAVSKAYQALEGRYNA